jgi:hypothetical protein
MLNPFASTSTRAMPLQAIGQAMPSQAMSSPFPNTTQAMSSPFPNTTQSMSSPFPNTTQSMSSPFPNTTQAMSSPFPNTTQSMSSPFPNTTQAMSSPFPNTTQAMSSPFPNTTQAMSSPFPNTTQATLPQSMPQTASQAVTQSKCPVCDEIQCKPYMTQKTCNCEIPLALISGYIDGMLSNKNTGYNQYLSTPLQTETQKTATAAQIQTVNTSDLYFQIPNYPLLSIKQLQKNPNININYNNTLNKRIDPLQYPKLKSVMANAVSKPITINVLQNNKIVNTVQAFSTDLTYKIPNLYYSTKSNNIYSSIIVVTLRQISNPLPNDFINVKVSNIITNKPINGQIKVYYGNINGSSIGNQDQVSPPYLPEGYSLK